jgi:hypothetical protein
MADPIWGTSTPGAFGDLPPGPDRTLAFLERLYGPMSPRSREGLMPETASLTSLDEDPRITALREPGAAETAFGVMGDVAMQPVRAGESLGEALYDPTLANVTDAGVQTALTFGKPYAAAGSAGLGAIEALRRDLGMTLDSPASAVELTRRQKREMEMRRQEEDTKVQAEIRKIEAQGKASAQLEAEKMRIEAEAAAKASKRGEYDRAVQNAESVRDKELARVRRFSDTEFGKVYDKTGGALPFLAALGGGALHRAARGGSASIMDKYILPAAEGTGLAITANSIPLAYDAFLTDADNPTKSAFSAYSRELPPEHPRKGEFADYASSLPDRNPVRAAASEEFYDEFWPRVGISAMEGIPAALTGANLDRIRGRALGQKSPDLDPKKPPGRVSKWMDKMFGSSAPAAIPDVAPPIPSAPAAPKAAVAAKAAQRKKVSRVDLNWNDKTQRWHAPNGDFAKGGKPPE